MANQGLTFGLSPFIITDIQAVFAQHPEIERVLIFGSRAKGTFEDGSDIDLAVISSTLSNNEFTQIWNEIDELPVVFKIDCLHWNTLSNSVLKDKILQEGKLFYP